MAQNISLQTCPGFYRGLLDIENDGSAQVSSFTILNPFETTEATPLDRPKAGRYDIVLKSTDTVPGFELVSTFPDDNQEEVRWEERNGDRIETPSYASCTFDSRANIGGSAKVEQTLKYIVDSGGVGGPRFSAQLRIHNSPRGGQVAVLPVFKAIIDGLNLVDGSDLFDRDHTIIPGSFMEDPFTIPLGPPRRAYYDESPIDGWYDTDADKPEEYTYALWLTTNTESYGNRHPILASFEQLGRDSCLLTAVPTSTVSPQECRVRVLDPGEMISYGVSFNIAESGDVPLRFPARSTTVKA